MHNPPGTNSNGLKFSLVIATKNRVAELGYLLKSLVHQKYDHVEVIIVDQNEDGRLLELVSGFSQCLEIIHIRSETGLSKARNAGLQLVTGDIVAFPDDDCVYPSDLLDMLNQLFVKNPSYDGIAGVLTESVALPIKPKIIPVSKKNIWKAIKSATVFLRKVVIKNTGFFDENLGIGSPAGLGAGEETDYLLRAVAKGFNVFQITTIKIIHPPIIRDFNQWRKVFSYTKGYSYLLKKYQFPSYIFLYQVVRPAIGIVFFGIFLQSSRVKYYYYSLKGKVSGYFYPLQ
jgi:glycosyltransferase involved in cell wall biosynthesis